MDRCNKSGGKRQRVEDTAASPPVSQRDKSPSLHRSPEGDADNSPTTGQKFHNKLLSDLNFIEICAGSARLTRAARDAGFNGMAIDHSSQRSCGIDICIFELEDPAQVTELCHFVESEANNIAAIWIAPSCGTASKARERKLPQLQQLGIAVPVPLRSVQQPDQLDGLDGTDKLKVEKANLLYDAVEKIAITACKANIFTSIENPTNSHYWSTTPMQNVMQRFGNAFVTFHNCCHGGSRDKLTSVWVNKNWLDTLEARCDGSHEHKSWKVSISSNAVYFHTAEEAAYPLVLCQRIVECIKSKVLQLGALSANTLDQQLGQPDAHEAGRIALGALPRGVKVKPLVAEFGHYQAVVAPLQQTTAVDTFLIACPKGSKITSRQVWKRGEIRVVQQCEFLQKCEQLGDNELVELCWIGIPSEPDEFVKKAFRAGHPRGLDVHVDESMKQVIKMNLLDPPCDLAKKRVEYLKRWTARAKELNEAEAQLRRSMPEHVKRVLGRKRLVLFGEMLADLGYPDKGLVQDMAEGFRLSGYMHKSHVFRAKSKRPSMSVQTLRKLGRTFNANSVEALSRKQEPELEEATWRETEAELERGWIFLDQDGDTTGKFFGAQVWDPSRVEDSCDR